MVLDKNYACFGPAVKCCCQNFERGFSKFIGTVASHAKRNCEGSDTRRPSWPSTCLVSASFNYIVGLHRHTYPLQANSMCFLSLCGSSTDVQSLYEVPLRLLLQHVSLGHNRA